LENESQGAYRQDELASRKVTAPGDSDGDYGEIGGMKIGKGTEVLGENLLQRHFIHHKSHMTRPGFELSRHGGKPATNRLSYGMALWKLTQEALSYNIGQDACYTG
jgi:hypothetical protein